LREWASNARRKRNEESEMKKARYSEEQIVRILREADCCPVAEVAKRHGISEPSIYQDAQKLFFQMPESTKRVKISPKSSFTR